MADKIEEKALALVNKVRIAWGMLEAAPSYINRDDVRIAAICRAIEAHEAEKVERQADKQAFSDAVVRFYDAYGPNSICPPWSDVCRIFDRFIIKKPDPLESAWNEVWEGDYGTPKGLDDLRQALAARGLKIVEANNAPL